MNKVSVLTGWSIYFLFCLLIVLGFYLVVVGVTLSRRRRPTLRVCVNSPTTRYGRVEHRSPAKKHKETFLLFALFTDEKRGKSHIRSFLPYVSPPASSHHPLFKQPSPSGANIASEPSNRNLITATGSKRSSADSDLLLRHVRLWRTSRLSFWQKFGREHGEIGFILIIHI